MDSPKRKAQKNKDYRRHRMMRLLNRRKATAQEAMSEIAERELMRRLRITPLKKFEDGKDAEYDAGVLDDIIVTGNGVPISISSIMKYGLLNNLLLNRLKKNQIDAKH